MVNNNQQSVIFMRVGEIFLKGKNRWQFEKRLIENIKRKLQGVFCTLSFERNRYIVSDYSVSDTQSIISKLQTVFGLHSLSTGLRVPSDFDAIAAAALSFALQAGTFRITVNRGDKSFKYSSMELARELGAHILDKQKKLTVDLHNPNCTINVDVREEGVTYLYRDKIQGAGGMPVGSGGKGLLLLSGGIDSPVAGYAMAKRGLQLDALHFHSYPYTSQEAQDKVKRLKAQLENYCQAIPLLMVPFTKIQQAIQKHCNDSYSITIMRRIMMQIAKRVAVARGCGCLVNGECLAQVASQTLESLAVTNEATGQFLVLRPLIGCDKQEIIEIAKRIGTYDISIEPYEDCCTVFLPESPIIKPKLELCVAEQARIPCLSDLVDQACEGTELI